MQPPFSSVTRGGPTTAIVFALAIAATAVCTGCSAEDPATNGGATGQSGASGSGSSGGAGGAGGAAGEDGGVEAVYPVTCAELKAQFPGLVDGEAVLYFPDTTTTGGDPTKPWTAYCAGMNSGAPKEYLPFQLTGPNDNFSQYSANPGGGLTGDDTDVRTNYMKVRFDPVLSMVDTSDRTFSTSMGALVNPPAGPLVISMPYGRCGDCNAGAKPTGIGNIDLRGTPFTVAPDQFIPTGFMGYGSATYSHDNQVVDLSGGGFCGTFQSTPPTGSGGFQLRLSYEPMAAP